MENAANLSGKKAPFKPFIFFFFYLHNTYISYFSINNYYESFERNPFFHLFLAIFFHFIFCNVLKGLK